VNDLHPPRNLETTALLRRIQRIVAEATNSGEILRAGSHAALLHDSYPNCGLSIGNIVNEIMIEATRRGVPVEIATPDTSQDR
jgi:hypothetical protein